MSARPQLTPDEVKAQRAAKAAEKQSRVAAAASKKEALAAAKSGGVAAPASSPSLSKQSSAASSSSSASITVTPASAQQQKGNKSSSSSSLGSPASTPSRGSQGQGMPAPTLALEKRDSQNLVSPQSRDRAGSSEAPVATAGKKGKPDVKRHQPAMQFDDPKRVAAFDKKAVVVRTAVQKQVPLFSHLPQYERETSLSLKLKVGFSSEEIHPAILRLGLQYAAGSITGSNARCVAMLTAFQQFIQDYHTPPAKVMRDDLLSKLKPLVRFLIDSRPQSISMGNAIRYLKMRISKIDPSQTDAKAKENLLGEISAFIQRRIEYADEVIATHGCSKITEGDVILTYACSHVVESLLKKAHAEGKKFTLIIVDSRPKLEGRELMRRLVQSGIKCTYIMINALSYVMKSVNKVILGAGAVLSNGSVIGRVGSAVVSMIAHLNNVPLLICCETYKFHERVQLDSIGFNELGDPDELVITEQEQDNNTSTQSSTLSDWRDLPNLKLLNLVFDLTPVTFVTMIITENGMIPPTSVPVILREYADTGEEAN